MDDETVRLAARLARQAGMIHPLDWVKVYESHTPYEWSLQVALNAVEPWGEDRADLREARNTAFLIGTNRTEPMPDDDFHELLKSLARYLKIHQEPEKVVSAKMLRAALGEA